MPLRSHRLRSARLTVLAAVALGLAAVPAADAARSWRPPVALSDPSADAWIGKPVRAAAFTPLGDAAVAWLEERTVAARIAPKVGAPGPRRVLGGGFNYPTVTSVGALRGSAVAWVGSTTPGSPGDAVLVATSNAAGGFEVPRVVARTGSYYNQPGAAIAGNTRGELVVVYVSDGRLLRVRRSIDGAWSEPVAVTTPLGLNVWRLQAQMSETGEAAYSWYGWTPATGNGAGVATESPAGEITPTRRLTADDARAGAPSLAMDGLGRGVVTWLDLQDGNFAGRIHAAVKPAGGPFGAAIALDGSASDYAGAPVALSASGQAVVAFAEMIPRGAGSGSGGPIKAIVGSTVTGTFGHAERVVDDLAADPVAVAADPLGNALFFFVDWDTYEARVVRRSVSGRYGQARNAVPCPNPGVYPLLAGVDPLGDAALLWAESNFLKGRSTLMLSRDVPSAAFGPDPCPAPTPWLSWTANPQPGQLVQFDAAGADDPDAASVEFAWDLDGDGTFETATGNDRHASTTFAAAGVHRVGLVVTQHSQAPGNSVTMTCYYDVRVGLPPEQVAISPDPWGTDPPPSVLPAENPWPTEPGPSVVGLVRPTRPLPDLPPPAGVLSMPSLLAAASARQPQELALAVAVAASARRRDVARLGLPVVLRSGRSGRVRLKLQSASGALTAKTVALRAGTPRVVRLRPARARGRALRSARRLTIVARDRATVSRATVRLRK
jgi:PKD repeat protein